MTDEATEDQTTTAAEPQTPADEQADAPSSRKEEIDRLTREAAEDRSRFAQLWGAVEHLAAQGKQPAGPSPQPEGEDTGPPRRENFTDDVAYLQALQKHQLDDFAKKVPEVIETTLRERQKQESEARRDAGIRDHVAKGRGLHHDFDQVIRNMPIDELFLDMVGQFDDPHEVTYALGKDPKELARIMSLLPARRAFEIGKVSDRLRATAPAHMEAIEPVKGHGATPSMRDTTSPASDKLSDQEWRAAERERIRAKNGG